MFETIAITIAIVLGAYALWTLYLRASATTAFATNDPSVVTTYVVDHREGGWTVRRPYGLPTGRYAVDGDGVHTPQPTGSAPDGSRIVFSDPRMGRLMNVHRLASLAALIAVGVLGTLLAVTPFVAPVQANTPSVEETTSVTSTPTTPVPATTGTTTTAPASRSGAIAESQAGEGGSVTNNITVPPAQPSAATPIPVVPAAPAVDADEIASAVSEQLSRQIMEVNTSMKRSNARNLAQLVAIEGAVNTTASKVEQLEEVSTSNTEVLAEMTEASASNTAALEQIQGNLDSLESVKSEDTILVGAAVSATPGQKSSVLSDQGPYSDSTSTSDTVEVEEETPSKFRAWLSRNWELVPRKK